MEKPLFGNQFDQTDFRTAIKPKTIEIADSTGDMYVSPLVPSVQSFDHRLINYRGKRSELGKGHNKLASMRMPGKHEVPEI